MLWGRGPRRRLARRDHRERHRTQAAGNGAGKVNAFLCGLRTSVFFVIREAMGGFSFNRYSRLGGGHTFETQDIFSRGAAVSAEKRKGRGSMAGGFHPAFSSRSPRRRGKAGEEGPEGLTLPFSADSVAPRETCLGGLDGERFLTPFPAPYDRSAGLREACIGGRCLIAKWSLEL